MNTNAALEQSHAGVKQDGLHSTGDTGVAQGHVYGQGFVPAVDIGGAIYFVNLLAGQGFPDWGPLRARRRYDVIYAQVAESLENGVAAVFGLSLRHRLAS